MKTLEKIFSVFLALQLCFTALPIQTFAQTAEEANIEQSTEAPFLNEAEVLKEGSEADKPNADKQQRDTESILTEDVMAESSGELQTAGGNGSIENPYQIATAEQLDSIRYDTENHYYIQTQDIDLSGYDSWEPIGNEKTPFRSFFDGNQMQIKNLNINIEKDVEEYRDFGLFGSVANNNTSDNVETFKNIIMENANITGELNDAFTIHANIGIIAGTGNFEIKNCETRGSIKIENNQGCNDLYIGGIVGKAGNYSSIKSCKSSVKIESSGYSITVGGIAGESNCSIADCQNNGYLRAHSLCDYTATIYSRVGGITGNCFYGSVENSINRANIISISDTEGGYSGYRTAGGIAGSTIGGSIFNCKNAGEKVELYIRSDNGEYIAFNEQIGRIVGGPSCALSDNMALNTMTINGKVPTEDIGPDKKNGQSATLAEMGLPDDPKPPEKPTKIILWPEYHEMNIGATLQITPKFEPEGTTAELVWESSDENVAVVNENGVIRGIDGGLAQITAKTKDGKIVSNKVEVGVKKEYPAFDFKKDKFNFINSKDTRNKNAGFSDRLNYFTPEAKKLLYKMDKTVSEKIMGFLIDQDENGQERFNPWNGSCYGMSNVMAINKYDNRLDLSKYQPNTIISNLYDYGKPKDIQELNQLLSYYSLSQNLPSKKNNEAAQRYQATHCQNDYYAQEIVKSARRAHLTGRPFILSYSWFIDKVDENNWFLIRLKEGQERVASGETIGNKDGLGLLGCGHTVMVYDIKEDDRKDFYEIFVCDPNNMEPQILKVYKDYSKIEYKDFYYLSDFRKESTFFCLGINEGIDLLDPINIEGRDYRETETKYSQTYLDVDSISAFSVSDSTGNTHLAFQDGMLSPENAIFTAFSDEDQTAQRIEFPLEKEDIYTVKPQSKNDFDCGIIYQNSYLQAKGSNLDTVTYDPVGKVELKGEESSYQAALTLNEDNAVLPWYTLSANGENASNVSIESTQKGILIKSNHLKSVKIIGKNDVETKELTINTDEDAVLLKEKDNYLAAYTDTDKNGTYDTLIAESDVVLVTDVSLNKKDTALKIGETTTLTVTITPENATNRNVSWSSSDEKIATVKDGVITAVAEGKAAITVTTEDGDKTAVCNVTVSGEKPEVIPVTGVSLDKREAVLKVGETGALTATVAPKNATNKNVSWSSSDEKIAMVKGGVVTAVSEGKATITVATEDGNKTATCIVTVTKKDEPKPADPTTPTVKPGDNGQSGSNSTNADTTVQTSTKNNGANPGTALTTQEKISTLLVMCTVTALCALAIFSIKRRQTK